MDICANLRRHRRPGLEPGSRFFLFGLGEMRTDFDQHDRMTAQLRQKQAGPRLKAGETKLLSLRMSDVRA